MHTKDSISTKFSSDNNIWLSKDLVERLSYRALPSIPFLSFAVDWLFGIYKPFNQNAQQLRFWGCINSTHVRRVSHISILITGSLHFQLLFCFVAIKATTHEFLTDHKYSELDRPSQKHLWKNVLSNARIVKWIRDYLDKLSYELKLAIVHSCKRQWTRQANSLPMK